MLTGSGYTIQVLATPEQEEAFRVADHYDASHVVHVFRQQKPTYVVLVGEFEDAREAREHIKSLTEQHPGSSPWVRTFSQLRDDVEALAQSH